MASTILIHLGEASHSIGRRLAGQLHGGIHSTDDGTLCAVILVDQDHWFLYTPNNLEASDFLDWHSLKDALAWPADQWKDTTMAFVVSSESILEWTQHQAQIHSVCDELDASDTLPVYPFQLALIPAALWRDWQAQQRASGGIGKRTFGTYLITDAVSAGANKPPSWPDGIAQSAEDWLWGWILLAGKDPARARSLTRKQESPYGAICVERSEFFDINHISESFLNGSLRVLLNKSGDALPPPDDSLTHLFADPQLPLLRPPTVRKMANEAMPWRKHSIQHWLKNISMSCERSMLDFSNTWQTALLEHKGVMEGHRRQYIEQLEEKLGAVESKALRESGIGHVEQFVTTLKNHEARLSSMAISDIEWLSSRHFTRSRIQEIVEEAWKGLPGRSSSVAIWYCTKLCLKWWGIPILLCMATYFTRGWHTLALIAVAFLLTFVPVLIIIRKRRSFLTYISASWMRCLDHVKMHFDSATAAQHNSFKEKARADALNVVARRTRNWESWRQAIRTRFDDIDPQYPSAPSMLTQRLQATLQGRWNGFIHNLGRSNDVVGIFENEVIDPMRADIRAFVRTEWQQGLELQNSRLMSLAGNWRFWPHKNPLLAPVNHGMVRPQAVLLFPYSGNAAVAALDNGEKLGLLQGEGLEGEYIVLGIKSDLGIAAFNAIESNRMPSRGDP